jgi:hypothetical protein
MAATMMLMIHRIQSMPPLLADAGDQPLHAAEAGLGDGR